MKPEELAKSGTEHAHQRAYFAWLNMVNRDIAEHIFAIPNGGARGNDRRTAQIRGNTLKTEGVKSGVPDIFCAWPWGKFHGLFIEMKKMKGGEVSLNQLGWRARLEARGYKVVTAYNYQEAANATAQYFEQPRPFPHASDGG